MLQRKIGWELGRVEWVEGRLVAEKVAWWEGQKERGREKRRE